jgi:hypothetical protein
MPIGGLQAYLHRFFSLGARWSWVVNATPRPLNRQGKPRYQLYKRLSGAPRPVRTVAENLAPIRTRTPGRPVRSESLCRLSYRGLQCQTEYLYCEVFCTNSIVDQQLWSGSILCIASRYSTLRYVPERRAWTIFLQFQIGNTLYIMVHEKINSLKNNTWDAKGLPFLWWT